MNHLTYITQVCPHPQCNCSYDYSQGTILWILCQIFKDDILQLKFILLADNLKFVETWEKKSKDRYNFERLPIFVENITIYYINLNINVLGLSITFLFIWKQTTSYQLQDTCNREIEFLYACTCIIYSVRKHVFFSLFSVLKI